MKRLTAKYLDPASRLGEILFGMIMILTVTLTAGLKVSDGKAGVRQLLFAAVGTNVAWGLIDAVMYIMNSMIVRRGKIRLVEGVQHATDCNAAAALIEHEVEPELQELLDPKEAEALSRSVLHHISGAHITKKILTKNDIYGAIASFWLVFVSCLPAALPFLFFSNPTLALRISNIILIVGLFCLGHRWASYSGRNPLLMGSGMVAVGLGLVGVAILLGG
jgi:hypothetical protein